ncbi:phenylacetate--CoA ligase family protein [Saccharopolyspora shandongensis]|uniref:phenylacetate--CoA ligase family protein n=1 Tax=Saccharopolyspora shandongensis TaxID=418495 RepID=UPI0033C99BEF
MRESMLGRLREADRLRRLGSAAMAERGRARLAAQVAYARANSPFYRRLYRGLPDRVTDPALLPVTGKKALMAEFDDWVTDRSVTWSEAQEFVADPGSAGRPFAGRYTLITTSGTTGAPGIFVVDERALAVNVALASRMRGSWLGAAGLARAVARGGRMALVVATGGHFLVAAGSERLFANPVTRRLVRVFSAHASMAELVAGLNGFRPAIVIGYASVLSLLAREQREERLHIDPVLVETAGEAVAPGERERMAAAFGARIRDTYGATECPFLTDGCAHGWYHVNSDWAVLEPVDADHRPVAPGELSHTVLVSNLANQIQPILRYDLGDSVLQRPDACPCGDLRPAFRVRGRVANALTFHSPGGEVVEIPSMVLNTLIDRVPGVGLFQAEQTGPMALRIRLTCAADSDAEEVWRAVLDGVARALADRGLGGVDLQRAAEPPRQGRGGKFRTAIPFDPAQQGESSHDGKP